MLNLHFKFNVKETFTFSDIIQYKAVKVLTCRDPLSQFSNCAFLFKLPHNVANFNLPFVVIGCEEQASSSVMTSKQLICLNESALFFFSLSLSSSSSSLLVFSTDLSMIIQM